MFKISDIEKSYISMYDTRNEEISYFFNIVDVDRKYIDDSFTHNFGLCRFGYYEFDFDIVFEEALNDNGDVVLIDHVKIASLTEKLLTLIELEDSELLNKIYFN